MKPSIPIMTFFFFFKSVFVYTIDAVLNGSLQNVGSLDNEFRDLNWNEKVV